MTATCKCECGAVLKVGRSFTCLVKDCASKVKTPVATKPQHVKDAVYVFRIKAKTHSSMEVGSISADQYRRICEILAEK